MSGFNGCQWNPSSSAESQRLVDYGHTGLRRSRKRRGRSPEDNYTPCIWHILMEADEDLDNPNNVIAIYTRRSIPKSRRDHGQNDQDSWNREHVWAKSHGFKKKSQHAYTDAHHLAAG